MDEFFDLDIFDNFGTFDKNFIEKLQKRMNEIEKAIQSGQLKGDWNIQKIDKHGVKGYIIQGFFSTNQRLGPVEPFEPIRPLRRRPMPKELFSVPKAALKEPREPLTDIVDEDKAIKIYVELPGEEKNDIQMNFNEDKVEIKAKNFYKLIDLPTKDIDREAASSKYKNGVLEISIPKKAEFKPKQYKL